MPLHAAIEALSNAHPASRLDLGGLLNADRAKPGNANVEVLCMAMQDMPLTTEALKVAKGDAEWLRMQWLLLALLKISKIMPGQAGAVRRQGKCRAGSVCRHARNDEARLAGRAGFSREFRGPY